MKKSLEWLADLMVQKRWFLLLWNGGLIAMMAASAYFNFTEGRMAVAVLDAFIVGAIAGSSLQLFFARGLYRGLDSYESAMMRADIEKEMEKAWVEFNKAHPEMEETSGWRMRQ